MNWLLIQWTRLTFENYTIITKSYLAHNPIQNNPPHLKILENTLSHQTYLTGGVAFFCLLLATSQMTGGEELSLLLFFGWSFTFALLRNRNTPPKKSPLLTRIRSFILSILQIDNSFKLDKTTINKSSSQNTESFFSWMGNNKIYTATLYFAVIIQSEVFISNTSNLFVLTIGN